MFAVGGSTGNLHMKYLNYKQKRRVVLCAVTLRDLLRQFQCGDEREFEHEMHEQVGGYVAAASNCGHRLHYHHAISSFINHRAIRTLITMPSDLSSPCHQNSHHHVINTLTSQHTHHHASSTLITSPFGHHGPRRFALHTSPNWLSQYVSLSVPCLVACLVKALSAW